MFGFFRKDKTYDEPINAVLEEMKTYGPDTPEFQASMDQLERLSRMKAECQKSAVSADTAAIVLGNLVGILIIVGYERGHVMTTRAKDFVLKTK